MSHLLCRTQWVFLAAATAGLTAVTLPQSAAAATILMDFGPGTPSTVLTTTDASGRSWNNVLSTSGDSTPFALNWTDTASSGVTLSVSNISSRSTGGVGFNDNVGNTAGTTAPTGTAAARGYPVSATRDTLYGNTSVWQGFHAPDLLMTLAGLQASMTYDLYFFASRTGASDVRTTDYAVQGLGDLQTVTLNAANNTGNVVSVLGVSPTASGVITVALDAAASNTNPDKFYYLGVMEIVAVPEPTSLAGVGLAAAMLFRRKRA